MKIPDFLQYYPDPSMLYLAGCFTIIIKTTTDADLIERVHGEEGDPRDVQAGDDLVGNGRLAAGAATADTNHQRVHQSLT